MKKAIASMAFFLLPPMASASVHTPPDYSGHYQCVGMDSHIGEFRGVVDMTHNPEQSNDLYSAYQFTLTLEDKSRYEGFAAANAKSLAIYFAHTDPSLKDYGVGIATVEPNSDGKVTFTKYYYAPEYQGGGHGLETCTRE